MVCTELTVTSEAEVCSRFGAGKAVIQWKTHGAGGLPVNGSVTYGNFLFRSVVDKPKLYAHMQYVRVVVVETLRRSSQESYAKHLFESKHFCTLYKNCHCPSIC